MKIEVLCLGHAACDLIVPLEKFPEENTKYSIEELFESSGGPACNAASLLGLWGFGCAFAGLVGRDAQAELVLAELAAAGVDASQVQRPAGFATPLSIIITSAASGSRTIVNRRRSGRAHAFDRGLAASWDPAVLLFDGHEPESSLAALETFPRALSVLDAGSLRPGTRLLAPRVDYLVASERFAADFSGEDTDQPAGLARALSALFESNGRHAAVTLGERGCVFRDAEASGALQARPAKAVDTTAAGDVFHGAFAAGLLEGRSFLDCLRLATVAAGLSVERRGGRASIPERGEVLARYREQFGPEEFSPRSARSRGGAEK